MLARDFDAYGFEPGETYGSFARDALGDRMQLARWQDIHHNAFFDLVTRFHVFEHLASPPTALRRAASLLKRDGLLSVEVPHGLKGLAFKAFGSFHFVHFIGFSHHNLLLAAGRARLTPGQTLSPTAIIFRKDSGSIDLQTLSARAKSATAQYRQTTNPGAAFLRYQWSKASRFWNVRKFIT